MISLGVDIGKKRDPAALVQVESDGPRYRITHCGRAPLGTPYDQLAGIIGGIAEGADVLTADAGGVGEAVLDQVAKTRPKLALWRVTLTGGKNARLDCQSRIASIPKPGLVRHVLAAMGAGRLVMDANGASEALAEELQRFEARQNGRGHVTLAARNGYHDDLVMALGLALLGFKLHAMRP